MTQARKTLIIGGAVVVLILAGLFAWWWTDLRWRPKTLDVNNAEIIALLEKSGWVSPGNTGPALYMVSFRTCPDCIRYKEEEFPKLHAAGVDTRVIMFARADKNGVQNSTPAERATVAQLWLTRDWSLLQRWMAGPPQAWTAVGIPPADGDMARTGVVSASRQFVEEMSPLLKKNGISMAYPTLIWTDRDGRLRGCACEKPGMYKHVLKELGVKG